MKKPTISIIAAIDKKRGMGKDNQLPWYIPEDFKHFREITLGHPVIMGRKTFESIGQPLEGRINIVLSSNQSLKLPNCIVVNSIGRALDIATEYDKDEIFVIGGYTVYNQSISFVDKLYLTIIDSEFDANIYFPEYKKRFKEISSEEHNNHKFKFKFIELERIRHQTNKG